MKFYSKLPKKAVTALDEAYSKYKDINRIQKAHAKDFKKEEDKYFYEANRELYEGNNKYLNFIKKNKKYDYDDTFSYLEQKANTIILRTYYLNNLDHILYIDLNNNKTYGYWARRFKQTNVVLMVDLSTSYNMFYNDGWGVVYSHNQRLIDKESIKILKSIEKFKYLPIELFDKINYYMLLNATKKQIHHYELLLKQGAIRIATQLMLKNRELSILEYRKYKDIIKANRSFKYLVDKITDDHNEEIKKRKRITKRITNKKIDKYLSTLPKRVQTKWKYKDYVIFIPKSLDEVKKESETLKHCLYSSKDIYLKNMIQRKNIILFLRKQNKIEDPFFTIEIKGDSIQQVRTYQNETSSKISKVVNEWFDDHRYDVLQVYSL